MTNVLRIIDSGDTCSLVFLIGVLAVIGVKFGEGKRRVRNWGLRFSAATFLTYSVYGTISEQPQTVDDWLSVVWRSLLAGGLCLGPSWIALAVLSFFHQHSVRPFVSRFSTRHGRNRERRRSVDDENRREEEQRSRSEAERDKRQRAEEQSRKEASDQTRRSAARAEAALTFSRYQHQLGQRFTKKMFREFVASYMGDDVEPQMVERLSREVVGAMERLLEDSEPATTLSLEELTKWYLEQQSIIESLPLDDIIKRVQQAELSELFAERSKQVLGNLQP